MKDDRKKEIIDAAVEFVKNELTYAEKGHDWWHASRVWKNTRKILEKENGNELICEIAALVHDIADTKFEHGQEGKNKIEEFLASQDLSEKSVSEILFIIENISFSDESFRKVKKNPELNIVSDADRLDAMGAIGIARAFHYGGFKNRVIYNPSLPPQNYSSKENYRKSNSPTINHFYEKLLVLKDMMNTQTGKELASQRHEFMVNFLRQFYTEWD